MRTILILSIILTLGFVSGCAGSDGDILGEELDGDASLSGSITLTGMSVSEAAPGETVILYGEGLDATTDEVMVGDQTIKATVSSNAFLSTLMGSTQPDAIDGQIPFLVPQVEAGTVSVKVVRETDEGQVESNAMDLVITDAAVVGDDDDDDDDVVGDDDDDDVDVNGLSLTADLVARMSPCEFEESWSSHYFKCLMDPNLGVNYNSAHALWRSVDHARAIYRIDWEIPADAILAVIRMPITGAHFLHPEFDYVNDYHYTEGSKDMITRYVAWDMAEAKQRDASWLSGLIDAVDLPAAYLTAKGNPASVPQDCSTEEGDTVVSCKQFEITGTAKGHALMPKRKCGTRPDVTTKAILEVMLANGTKTTKEIVFCDAGVAQLDGI